LRPYPEWDSFFRGVGATESAAMKPSKLGLGAVLAVVVAGSGASLLWLQREAPVQTPAPAGQVGEDRWVARRETFVHEDRTTRSRALLRLSAGERLRVMAHVEAGESVERWREIISGRGEGGFVLERETVASPPSAASLLEDAKMALAGGRLVEAAAVAEAAVSLEADQRDGWELLAAIYDARRDVVAARRAYRELSRLGPRASKVQRRSAPNPPVPGELRYVAATRLRLREAPNPTARILDEVLLNTRLEVVERHGEFAHVRWTPPRRTLWRVDLTDGGRATLVRRQGEPVDAFASWAYLSSAPADLTMLLREAELAGAEGRHEDEARALERASMLPGADTSTEERLMQAATRAGLYRLAAEAAARGPATSGARRQGAFSAKNVELSLFFGCSSDPTSNPAARCIEDVDAVGSCPPCPVVDMGLEDESQMSPRELQELGREADEALRKYEAEMVTHRAEAQKLQDELRAVREEHPFGPYLRVRIAGANDAPEGSRAFVYARPFSIGGHCSTYETDVGPLAVGGDEISWPDADETVEIWVVGPGYANTLYGVQRAGSREELETLVQEPLLLYSSVNQLPVEDPGRLSPQPNVVGAWNACLCCGC
jgi:hypothetical protein